MGWEWTWEEGDTRESLMCEADEFADEIAALLDACSEHAPAMDRVAVQLVSLRGRLNLGHQQIEGTLGDWPDARLREALRDFAPKPYAPLTLIKVVTEEMLRGGSGLYLDNESRWVITDETAANRAEREDPTAALAWRQAQRVALEKVPLVQVRSHLLGSCTKEGLLSDAPLDIRRALDLFDMLLFSLPINRVGHLWIGG